MPVKENKEDTTKTNNMSEYYSFYGDGDGYLSYRSANNTSDQDGELPTTVEIQAVFVFLLGLAVYFCMVCNIWCKDGSITKKEVERSVVHKRVLAHGQSHCFDCEHNQDDECIKEHFCCGNASAKFCHPCRSVTQYCCRRNQTRAILPAPTDDIKNSNRSDPTIPQTECANTDAEQEQASISDLEQAEQGLVTVALDEELTCPICLEPMKCGEEVAWSKLRKCLHVYHYECITRWLFDGNMHCPVCRDRYWKRNYSGCEWGENVCTNIIHRKQSDLSDNIAKRYRFCEVHGLTLPPIDVAEAEVSVTLRD